MAARFNPFARANSRYGAPMGRHGADASTYDGTSKLYAKHCGGDGYYDRGGAYWGHSKVCAVWTRGGEWCAYVEAYAPEDAIAQVKALSFGYEPRAWPAALGGGTVWSSDTHTPVHCRSAREVCETHKL